MKDLINEQPEQDIEHCATCIHAADSEDICILRKCKYAIAELKECYEPKQPEQRWIPWYSGRFPKESGTYTVTAYDGATKWVTFAKYQKRLKRWELTGARAYWRVLAWMPLPEPYREVSETDG